jgi:beta-galactosidase GanA
MKRIVFLITFLVPAAVLFAQSGAIPHLEKKGNITRLIVQGKPFLILGGELHNSSTSGAAYMRPIWAQMKKKNLNTVIAPVYWELLEPQEGKFDFSLVDSMIYGARKHQLRLAILWFGSWKNGYSMYAPAWVKKDVEKFKRIKNKIGEPFAVLSTLNEAAMKADAKAFKNLMQHIRQVDEKYQTVIMADRK